MYRNEDSLYQELGDVITGAFTILRPEFVLNKYIRAGFDLPDPLDLFPAEAGHQTQHAHGHRLLFVAAPDCFEIRVRRKQSQL